MAKARAYARTQLVRSTPHLAEMARALRILDKIERPAPADEAYPPEFEALIAACSRLRKGLSDAQMKAHPEPAKSE